MEPVPGVYAEFIAPPEAAGEEWLDWYDRNYLANRARCRG